MEHDADPTGYSEAATLGVTILVSDDLNTLAQEVGQTASGGVQANDTNTDGHPMTSVLNSGPDNGTLQFNSDGSFSYTPISGFYGVDSFTYYDVNGPADSNVATVNITVYATPVAADDRYATAEDQELDVTAANGVLANDSSPDGNTLTAVLAANPANGSVTLNPDGSFSYTPNDGFYGTDSFTYYDENGLADSNEATVYITVFSVPVANDDSYSTLENQELDVNAANGVLANDTNADHYLLTWSPVSGPTNGTLTAFNNNGSFSYVPNPGFIGTDSFTYNDTSGPATSNTATVTILVYSVPVANPDNYSAIDNQQLTVTAAQGVLANDYDADGDTMSAALYAGPAEGTLTLHPDGSFSYLPNDGFFGVDTFEYTAADSNATSSPALVTITVYSVPVANPDTYSVVSGNTLIGMPTCSPTTPMPTATRSPPRSPPVPPTAR